MTIQPESLRVAMRLWTTGVTIVTTHFEGQLAGMTVSSFTSVSLEPPTVLVCLNKSAYAHNLVQQSGVYAISLLGKGQSALSNRFAGLDPTVSDRFEGVAYTTAKTGAPLLAGAIAHFDCVVRSTHDTLTHTIFVAEVVAVWSAPDGVPLVYHNRGYHELIPAVS
jgi:flavin reductase (DIM6/NTAB) family NADH-FMN oxidoreductase RutF